MASTFPEILENYKKSLAEVKLFNALKSKLSDEYSIFHSVAWLTVASARTKPYDGEADFVILHPRKGVLIVEVKGGQIRYDPARGWQTKPFNATEYQNIKDPFNQAKDNKHSLRRKITSLPEWGTRSYQDGHCVAFPDGSMPALPPKPDVDSRITIGELDLETIDQKIDEIYDFWNGEGKGRTFTGFDTKALKMIVDLLGIKWETYIPRLGERLNKELAHISRLSEEQFDLLNALNRHRRIAIAGPAGSGKTILAIKKAEKLAREGMRTLLVCYNQALAEYLRTITPAESNLEIYNFHSLCAKLASGTQRGEASEKEFYEKILPEALMQVTDDFPEEKLYDAIIVDEGQDFQPDWLLTLGFLMHERNESIFYIFFDDNQNLYQCDLSGLGLGEPFLLTKNYRNTREIFKTLLNYYKGQHEIKSHGPTGSPVVINSYTTARDLKTKLINKTVELVFREKVPEQSIVILGHSLNKGVISQINALEPFSLVKEGIPQSLQIRLSTIHSYKGLERPVVILIMDEDIDHNTELMYVAISRATNRLFIYKPEKVKLLHLESFATP